MRPGRGEAVDLIFQQDADRLSFLVPERHRRMRPRRSPSSAARPFPWPPTCPPCPPRGFWCRRAAMPISRTSAVPLSRVAPRVRFERFRRDHSRSLGMGRGAPGGQRRHLRTHARLRRQMCREAVRLAAQSYRESLAYFATLGSFDVWRAYLDVAEVLQGLADKVSKADRRQVAADLERAFSKTNERAFEKLCVWKTANPRWSTIRRISCRSAIFSPWTTSGASSAAWRACSTTTAQR